MKYPILLLLLLVLCLPLTAAKPPRPVKASETNWLADDSVPHVNVIVRGKGYKGVIFDTLGNYLYKFKHGRWLPMPADIAAAESLLTANAGPLLKEEPAIRAALPHYIRQYVGYLDEKGNRCVYINLFCVAVLEKFPDWDYAQVSQAEGGECFFEVNVDVVNRRVFGLVVSMK